MNRHAAACEKKGAEADRERTSIRGQVIESSKVIDLAFAEVAILLQKQRQPNAEEVPGKVDGDRNHQTSQETPIGVDADERQSMQVLVGCRGGDRRSGRRA